MSSSYTRLARRRRSRAGMTLTEIMIVVVIMALIATAVGVAVIPQLKRARITQTRTDAQTIRGAAERSLLTNTDAECPTVASLIENGEIGRQARTTDAWDNEFRISCEGDEIIVTSAGPDGQMGNEDDIH